MFRRMSLRVLTLIMVFMGIFSLTSIRINANTINVGGTARFNNTWLLAGPYDSDYSIGSNVKPVEGDYMDGHQWEYFDDRLYNRNLDDYQDLYGYYTVKKDIDVQGKKVYLHSYVYSPSSRIAYLKIGTTGNHTAYVNGNNIGTRTSPEEVSKDRDTHICTLNKGWNSVLIEIKHTRVHYLGFYARITDIAGNELSGLIYSVNGDNRPLAVTTKNLSFTQNNMPIGYKDWPYIGMDSILTEKWWRPQASKFEFMAEGGVAGYTWSLENGLLPDGLTLSSDGKISGTPSKIGLFDFTIKVTDSNGDTATKSLSIEIKERPNRWHEEARQSALIHNAMSYSHAIDNNYSLDLWARRMRTQGINFVYLESYQAWPNGFFWPAPSAAAGTEDWLTDQVEAVKRQGIKFGLYYGGIPTWNGVMPSSSGFVRDVEDLIKRYAPKQFFFDGYPNNQGNTDAMFSIVRVYDPEIIIEANPDPELGDCDTKIWEAHGYWGNPAPDYWRANDTKANPLEIWRAPYTSEMGSAWTGYHHGNILDDWQEFAKINIVEMASGYIANFDQLIQNSRVLQDGTVQQGFDLDIFAPTVQKLIKLREMYSNWLNPVGKPSKLESLIGTYPAPYNGKWGYSTYRDNNIYLHMIEHPDFIPDSTGDVSNTNKTGVPSTGSVIISPVMNNVTSVTLLNDDFSLNYTQNGNELTIDLSSVAKDPIDTIIKIETDKEYEGYELTDIRVSNKQISNGTIHVDVEGYLNNFAGLSINNNQFDNIVYESSDDNIATVDSNGNIVAASQGTADINVSAAYNGISKSKLIQVHVGPQLDISVNEKLISAVLKVNDCEAYLKMFHLGYGDISVEGIGIEGNSIDLTKADITYKTDMPNIIDLIDDKVIIKQMLSETDKPIRVAVWADIELDQGGQSRTVTTNKVFVDITPLRNMAQNKPVAASENSGTAGYANDGIIHEPNGSKDSRWIAATGDNGTYWQVDLGYVQPINNVEVRYDALNAYWKNVPRNISIQVSNDGSNWNTVVNKSSNIPSEGSGNGYNYFDLYKYDMNNANGRYVRLLFEDGSTNGINLLEVLVNGSDITGELAKVNVTGQETQTGVANLTVEGLTVTDEVVDISNGEIKVVSCDTNVVSVNSNNILNAESQGSATIYAVVKLDNMVKAGSITVDVDSSGHINFDYPLETIALTADKSSLGEGESAHIAINGYLSNGQVTDLSNAFIQYNIIEGSEYITLNDNTVTVSNLPLGTADVKIQAVVTLDGITVNSNILQLEIVGPTNLALNIIPTYSSSVTGGEGTPTDGVINSDYFLNLSASGSQWMQIDLGNVCDINTLKVWHYYNDERTYKDVVFQLSNDPTFSSGVVTVFNNDTDNSSGFGIGADTEYSETSAGKEVSFNPVSARYIRLWSNGSNINDWSHYVEVEVYGEVSQQKTNVALNKSVTASCTITNPEGGEGIVDGIIDTICYTNLQDTGTQWIQIDLGESLDIDTLKVWHYYVDGRTYKDVIFQLSNDADFNSGVTTVFNNDTDNSAGLGIGTDEEYIETSNGKEVNFNKTNARYIRLYTNGSNINGLNHYVEIEAF